MKADRWQNIEEIFHGALQRKPEERASFLNRSCAGDPALYDDVKALLTSYENDDSFFEDSASALAAEMFADRVGDTIGPYEVLSQLGSGAMGVVYLAQDVRLGRKIALKLLPSQFTNDKDRLRRFQQEARAASALNHPNILTVYEVEQRDGAHYIATEFVDGVTLRQHMQARQMSLDEVLAIATQVASALQAAHAAGIAHRDIKPENIMIRSDGYIKVLDFGLAKLTENELSPAAAETNPGVVMGTPRYMSPEQARGLDVDLRTDIFSLGTVIYELVTGKLPFEGETTSDVIAALIKDEPEPIRTTVPELPVEFEEVVSKALVKDRGQRYQTVGEFSSALQGLKDKIKLGALVRTNDDSLNAQTITTRTATDPQAKQKTERVSLSKGWTLTIALGLIVIVGVVTVLSYRRRSLTVNNSPSVSEKITRTSRQLTNRVGFISAARFFPDGKRVVYSAGFDGKPLELFYNNGEVAESRSAGIPASLKSVSRSGNIAVLLNFELNWSDGYNGTLQFVPLGGGQPEGDPIDGVDDVAFAPDGNNFAISRSGFEGQQQLEYPVGTVLYKSPGWMSYPRFSPAGDKIAFFEHPLGDFSGSIAVFDLASKQKTNISDDWQALKGLAWNPRTGDIWFGGSKKNKTVSINSVSLSGQLQQGLYRISGQNARVEDISADGRILINQGTNNTTMIIVRDRSRAEAVESGEAWSTSADISADGKTLLFYQWGYESSDGSDVSGVYLERLDGSEPVKLGPGKALALAPDGKWALALQPTKPQPQLTLLSTSLGQPKRLSNPGIKEYHYASFFPDGKQILFTGLEARDDAVIRSFVQDVNTGEAHPFTEEGTTALRVSPDGKRVITLQLDGGYYIQGLDGGEPKKIPGLKRDDEPIQWSNDGRAVFVKGEGDFATKIFRVDLATGQRREWKNIDPPNKVGNVGLEVNPGGILITPDGKVCIYTYWILLQQILSASIE